MSIKAYGHGKRQHCGSDLYGFPIRHARSNPKVFHGFPDRLNIVKAKVLSGKYMGSYTGRIVIRFKLSFKPTTRGKNFDVHPKYLKTIHKADGYEEQSSIRMIRCRSIYLLVAIPQTLIFPGITSAHRHV